MLADKIHKGLRGLGHNLAVSGNDLRAALASALAIINKRKGHLRRARWCGSTEQCCKEKKNAKPERRAKIHKTNLGPLQLRLQAVSAIVFEVPDKGRESDEIGQAMKGYEKGRPALVSHNDRANG